MISPSNDSEYTSSGTSNSSAAVADSQSSSISPSQNVSLALLVVNFGSHTLEKLSNHSSLEIAVVSDLFPVYDFCDCSSFRAFPLLYDLSLPQNSAEFEPAQCNESSTFLRYTAFLILNSSLYSLLVVL